MAASVQFLLTGAALGLSIAAPPGPVTALSAQRVASVSWLSGWLVMLGATAADGAFFVLTYFGVARLVTAETRGVLFILGGFLMLYLALSTARRARSPALPPLSNQGTASRRGRSPFLLGLAMGITNPYQLGWWVAIGAGMVEEFGPSIAAGFFVGILAWTLVFTWAMNASVTRYRRLAPAVAYASAVLIAAFGLWFLARGLLLSPL